MHINAGKNYGQPTGLELVLSGGKPENNNVDLGGSTGGQLIVASYPKKITLLRDVIASKMTFAALNCGLCFRAQREVALISGAGIAGLAASLELASRGYKVMIAEKYGEFSRSNIVNINVEAQRFLNKFGLLGDFEKFFAARISEHRLVHIGIEGTKQFKPSDVRDLKLGDESFEPNNFGNLFEKDGVYSIKIEDLQTFLAAKAMEAGVDILGNTEIELLERTEAGGVSRAQIKDVEGRNRPIPVKPDLFFIAEGSHSSTAKWLGMEMVEVESVCKGENWIFGNVKYTGDDTFVISMVDTSGEEMEIANVIFNGKNHEINIAVTSEPSLSQESIEKKILEVVQRAFGFTKNGTIPTTLLSVVKEPVQVKNERRDQFSRDNIFIIGDAAGRSSPLAGLGATLCLTLVARAVEQLLNDREGQPDMMHHNFQQFSEGYTKRWILKSAEVKDFCLGLLKGDRIAR